MLPEPTEGSYDWAKAGDAMIVARATAAMVVLMTVLLSLVRPAGERGGLCGGLVVLTGNTYVGIGTDRSHPCSRGKAMTTAEKTLSHERNDRISPRERILAAASDLFYRHGIRAVGVEAIAEAAETNKMTLYRHFPSKDELVAQYLRCQIEPGKKVWDELAARYPGDPRAQL